MPLGYEDYASLVEPQSKLDKVLDGMHNGVEKHLIEIARDLDNLYDLAIELGLKARDLKDIKGNYPLDIRRQRYDSYRRVGR